MRVLLLNGPNLNLLGTRAPEIYGTTTLHSLVQDFTRWASQLGVETMTFQSNHEGELIDRLHAAREQVDGIVFNPGAYTHTSYALRDAIEAIEIPTVEIHISNVMEREDWRRRSVIAPVVAHRIYGRGVDGYRWALRHLVAAQRSPARRISYGDDPQQHLDLRTAGDRLAVLVHGGFWRPMWSMDTMDLIAVDLAERGWSVANVEYRRTGTGGGWPNTRDDVVAAAHSAMTAVGTTSATLIGHSAGGQLALMAALELGASVTVVSMGGVNDMELAVVDDLGSGAARAFLGDTEPQHASPQLHPHQGRVIIAHGAHDTRVPARYGTAYAEAHSAELMLAADGDHFRFLEPADTMWTDLVKAISTPEQ